MKKFIIDAQISAIGGRPAVVVPVAYNQPMMALANFAGDFYFHLNYLTQLVIYSESCPYFVTVKNKVFHVFQVKTPAGELRRVVIDTKESQV